MKAVILAGGEGTRLKPLTFHRPKPLIPIAGRPCIDYVLRSLTDSGFREIVIATAYLSDRLIKMIGDGLGYDASILYSFEENPAGTAGAVRRVGTFLHDTFVVAMGDVLADVDFRSLIEFHKERNATATMALTEVSDPSEYGIAQLEDDGRVVRFQEKPKPEESFSKLVNAGIYVLEPEVLDIIPPDRKFDFARDVFPLLLANGRPVYGTRLRGVWMDIGHPQDLWKASMEVVRREGRSASFPGVECVGPMIVAESARVEAGARLLGPVYVADGVVVPRGVTIENACIYEKVALEPGVTVRNSIILDGSRLGRDAQVVDSVVSRGCTLEEGVRIASSIIGDDMTVKARSRLENANVSPPA